MLHLQTFAQNKLFPKNDYLTDFFYGFQYFGNPVSGAFRTLPKSFTFSEPTPQNGETHPNTSSAIDLFVGLALKGLIEVFCETDKG